MNVDLQIIVDKPESDQEAVRSRLRFCSRQQKRRKLLQTSCISAEVSQYVLHDQNELHNDLGLKSG